MSPSTGPRVPDEIRIRRLEPDDAEALSQLFWRVYGDSYGSPEFYDVDALAERIEARTLRSVVAASSAELLGHTGINVRDGGALVCETGNTVVDPAARGQGLLKRLGGALAELCRFEGFAGYVHFPTSAHEIMQRASVANDGVETGLMLAYVSEQTRYEAIDRAAGRLAATVAYQPFSAVPARMVRLPERYQILIQNTYAQAGLTRTHAPLKRVPTGARQVEMQWAARRSVLHGELVAGSDEEFDQLSAAIAEHSPALSLIDLLLDRPEIDAQVARLNSMGFFYSAVLPEFGSSDVLRLQRLGQPSAELFRPELVNPTAQLLLQSIVDDAERVLGSIPG